MLCALHEAAYAAGATASTHTTTAMPDTRRIVPLLLGRVRRRPPKERPFALYTETAGAWVRMSRRRHEARRSTEESTGFAIHKPAATYSPRPFQAKYHRRGGA